MRLALHTLNKISRLGRVSVLPAALNLKMNLNERKRKEPECNTLDMHRHTRCTRVSFGRRQTSVARLLRLVTHTHRIHVCVLCVAGIHISLVNCLFKIVFELFVVFPIFGNERSLCSVPLTGHRQS